MSRVRASPMVNTDIKASILNTRAAADNDWKFSIVTPSRTTSFPANKITRHKQPKEKIETKGKKKRPVGLFAMISAEAVFCCYIREAVLN
jgi:hypothetical protein